MRVLIALDIFQNLTGSELFCYELARALVERDHKVTIGCLSTKFTELTAITMEQGIDVKKFADVEGDAYDIIHANQHAAGRISELFIDAPIVYTCHSLNAPDEPIAGSDIITGTRPDIVSYLVNKYLDKRVYLTPNGFDIERFNTNDTKTKSLPSKPTVLFAGTNDNQRKITLLDLISKANKGKINLIIVGRKVEPYLDNINMKNVLWHNEVLDIEKFVKACDITAGIFLGRTTIEGWLCGKTGMIYNVDKTGKILSVQMDTPPKDLSMYYSDNVATRFLELYQEAIDDTKDKREEEIPL